MERSTIKETATNTVSTVATDQVGVKAKDLSSWPLLFSAISRTRKLQLAKKKIWSEFSFELLLLNFPVFCFSSDSHMLTSKKYKEKTLSPIFKFSCFPYRIATPRRVLEKKPSDDMHKWGVNHMMLPQNLKMELSAS